MRNAGRKRPASLCCSRGNLDRSFYGPVYHVSQRGRVSSERRSSRLPSRPGSVARAVKYGVDRTCCHTDAIRDQLDPPHRFQPRAIDTTIPPRLTMSPGARKRRRRDATPNPTNGSIISQRPSHHRDALDEPNSAFAAMQHDIRRAPRTRLDVYIAHGPIITEEM